MHSLDVMAQFNLNYQTGDMPLPNTAGKNKKPKHDLNFLLTNKVKGKYLSHYTVVSFWRSIRYHWVFLVFFINLYKKQL